MIETDVNKNGIQKPLPKVKNPIIPNKKEKPVELSIFDKVRNDPRYTQARSIDWFKTKINDLGGNSPSAKTDLFKTTKDKQTTQILPGAMYMYKYDPKTKDDLPFYDGFPLVIVIGLTATGWTALNLHYISYAVRAKLFEKLWLIASKYKNNKQQVLRLNWKLLSNVARFPEVRPCVKQYLYSHVQSRMIKIDVQDWKTAMLLPVETFYKKSFSYVARNSGQIIRKVASGK